MASLNKINVAIRRSRRLLGNLDKEESNFKSTLRAQSSSDNCVRVIGIEKPQSIEMKNTKEGFGTTSEGKSDNGEEISINPLSQRLLKNKKRSQSHEETKISKNHPQLMNWRLNPWEKYIKMPLEEPEEEEKEKPLRRRLLLKGGRAWENHQGDILLERSRKLLKN